MPQAAILTSANLPKLMPRAQDAHKGQFGQVLVVAGNTGMGGAGLLASQACLRTGAGLVSLATAEPHIAACLARQPEIMVHAPTQPEPLQALMLKASVILLGPGLGQSLWAKQQFELASQQTVAQVWDADALNLLSQYASTRLPQHIVLTPHPGEAARLLQSTTEEIQKNRENSALLLAKKYNAVVILKGFHSLIASPENQLCVCLQGHPAMAGAGFGDVLAGVVSALLAQHMSAFDAACLAVYLHANAGQQLGAQGRGLAASDLILPIRQLLEEHSPCQQ